MQKLKQHFINASLIFFGLLLAFAPVILSNNYLRQDDLMWEMWPGMHMSDFGFLYYNVMFQLVRPLCMLSIFITDLLSIDIQHAIYIRLVGVILLGSLGILLYWWQLLFNPNRLFAACFAIAAFTLPAYQVFAATGNYSIMIIALLSTFGAAFCWYSSFYTEASRRKRWLTRAGCALFFASLLAYPLSSMYLWVLIAICYLNSLSDHDQTRVSFMRWMAKMTLWMMVFYYVFSRLFHLAFHVHTGGGRANVISTHHVLPRLLQIFDVLSWHADLWFWQTTHAVLAWPIFVILGLFALALARIQVPVLKSIGIVLLLFFLAYAPILAAPDIVITFRYGLATMPILLYVIFWSCTTLSRSTLTSRMTATLFIGIALFGIYRANSMLAERIVGPHQHDFEYIEQTLNDQVIPLIEQHQPVLIHAIACDEGKSAPGVPDGFEYGMRVCQYQQQVISIIVHSLRRMGYASNYDKHNTLIYHDKEIIVKDIPWGTLVVNSPSIANHDLSEYSANHTLVTIDMRAIPPYEPFEFYQGLLRKLVT